MLPPVLQRFKTISKRKLWLSSILGFAMIGVVFFILTPEQPDTPLNQNYDGTKTKFSSVSYTGNELKPPKEFSLYSSKGYIEPNLLKNDVVNKFAAIVDEDDPGTWRSDSVMIAQINDPLRLSIAYDEQPTSDSADFFQATSQQSAQAIANNWVQTNLPGHNLTLVQNEIVYFAGDLELEESTPSLATYTQFSFAQTIEGFPLRTNNIDGYPLIILVSNNQQQVKKVTYYPLLLEFEYQTTAPSISVETAVKNINADKDTKIIYAKQRNDDVFSLSQLSQGRLSNAYIEYRVTTDNQIIPFYRFSGSFFDPSRTQISAEVVVPAI